LARRFWPFYYDNICDKRNGFDFHSSQTSWIIRRAENFGLRNSSAIACTAMAMVIYLLKWNLMPSGYIIVLSVCVPVGAVVFVGMLWLLKARSCTSSSAALNPAKRTICRQCLGVYEINQVFRILFQDSDYVRLLYHRFLV
jgi:hypothetical protein